MRYMYSKTFQKRPLSERPKKGFQNHSSLIAGQKYCRIPQGEHSAIYSTCIKLSFVIKITFCLFLSSRLRQVLLYYQNLLCLPIQCIVILITYLLNSAKSSVH